MRIMVAPASQLLAPTTACCRLPIGCSILTRNHSNIVDLSDERILAASVFQGDIKALQKNLAAKELDAVTPLSELEAADLVKDGFASAAERDIYTGDGLEIIIINRSGKCTESIELRKD